MKRWSIYIDIEGFSQIYKVNEVHALSLLGQLMKDLYITGTKIFPRRPDSLFIHQIGDGFIIVSDFPENNLSRPISIAIAVMQSTLLNGGVTRASISTGDFGDIQSCYPNEITNSMDEHGVLRFGEGVMTIFPVMGEALINSYKLGKSEPNGPCLLLDARLKKYLPKYELVIIFENKTIIEIDWVHSNSPLIDKILKGIDFNIPSIRNLEEALSNYIKKNPELSPEWVKNALNLIPRDLWPRFPVL